MAASEVEICNSALLKVGAARITSITEDSKMGRVCNVSYNKMRKKLLYSHPWNFAIRRAALAQTTNTPSYGYTYEYQVPSDVLRVLDTDLLEGQEWVLENNEDGDRVILTDYESIKIKYLKDVTDTTDFSPAFDEVLATLIAADIAYSLTGSRQLSRDLFNQYKEEIREARSFDAQEGSREEIEANPWIDVRS